MTISIPFSAEIEAKLRKQAGVAGKDLTSFVLEAVEEKLAVMDDAAENDSDHGLSADQWVARLRRWAASHRTLAFEADDSRESIYAGRGE